jgi:hypothetical protein
MFCSILLLVFCSCGSTQSTGNGIKTDKGISIHDFPFATISAVNGYVLSCFDAGIVDNPLSAEGQKIFGDNVVYSLSAAYKLYGKENTINYYAIVFDFKKTIDNTENVKYLDIIGQSTGKDPKILVFYKTADPYFVITCKSVPYYYEDFYWFEGSFLFPSGNPRNNNPKWLSFEPTDDIEKILIDMADHVTESSAGMVYYPDNTVRFKTKLDKYPQKMTDEEIQKIAIYENMVFKRTGIITHITEFQAGNYKYFLCWQRGFDQYLAKEYKLNADIWIYGAIVTYSIWNDCGYLFIRDYQLNPLEEMYESRVRQINAQKR